MDVIGAVSSVVGILAVTLQVARGVSNLIGEIKDAPQSLRRLNQELQDLESILSQIDRANVGGSKISIGSTAVEISLKTCRDELERLQHLLKPLAPKSAEDGIHRRTFQGFKKLFKDDDIREAVNALQSRKLSICLALMTSLASTKGLPDQGKKNVEDTLLELNEGGDAIDIPSGHRFLRRTTTFTQDLQTSTTVAVDIGVDGKSHQSYTKILEKIISQTIERTIQKIRGEFLQEPGSRVEDFLRINPMEAQQLWATNLHAVNEFRAADLERKREEFLQSLPSPDYHGDKIKAKNAQSGTCKWIYDHPQYLAWYKGKGPSILHAMGKPGSGKTVLSRHVFENLQEIDSDIESQVLYCFCNNRDNPNQTALDILGAMIHQFLSARNSLFPLIISKRQGILQKMSKSDTSPWSLESLWEIFLILVNSEQLDVVYCVIDALDECEAGSVSDLLSLISDEVVNFSKHASGGVARVRFFLTSRPFERLEVELDHRVARTIWLAPELVNQDIQVIVNKGMDRLQKRLRLKKEVKERLWGILVDRSEGMFLWVLLAMKQLDRARFVTAQKLEKLIQGLPNGLDGIYDRMLESLETNISDPGDLSLVRKMITWVVLTQRPLTVSEFKVAMAIELGSDSMDSIEAMLCISREIRNLCGSFLEVVSAEEHPKSNTTSDDNHLELEGDEYEDPTATVRLIHQSAKDYFFDREKRLNPQLSKFRIHEKHGHTEIASICLTYLLFKEFGTGPIRLGSDVPSTSPKIDEADGHTALRQILKQKIISYPFLGYAAISWGYHVQSSVGVSGQEVTVDPVIMTLISRFLQQPLYLEYWFQLYKFLKGSEQFQPIKINALHVVCLIDLPAIAAYILNNWKIDINERSGEGETALLFAIQAGIDTTFSQTLGMLLENSPDVNARDNNGRTALNLAARHQGQLSTVKMLLDKQADIEGRDDQSWTALHHAASNGHQEIVEVLLDRGADIKSTIDGGHTALYLVANKETAELLLDRGADLRYQSSDGSTAVHWAVDNERQDIVELLLARGADIQSINDTGDTPLHLAAQKGNRQLVGLLLESGANIASRCKSGRTPLHNAIRHQTIIELLLSRGADIESTNLTGCTALHMAAENGLRGTAELLLDKGADLEHQCDPGWTALLVAAYLGHQEIAELLLNRGADMEKRLTKTDQNALHLAVNGGHQKVTELLLSRGADFQGLNACGQNLLLMAAGSGLEGIVELLLGRGMDIESTGRHGYTALHAAAGRGHSKTVKLLLDKGADINCQSNSGNTALHQAARCGFCEIVEVLLSRGADIQSKNYSGDTPLHLAVKYGNQELVELFLDMTTENKHEMSLQLPLGRGMDIGSRDYDNWTILYTAILYNHTNISRLLVERCVCTLPKPKGSIVVHLGNQCGELLQYAVFNGNTEILELILNSVVNANAHSLTSMALHTAASEGNVDAIDLLLRSGANPHQVDRNGWSPIICAWKSRRQKGIERLLEAGAVLPDINHLSTKAPTCWSEASNLELLTLSKKNLLIEVLGKNTNQILGVRSDYCIPAEKAIFYYEIEIVKKGHDDSIHIGLSRGFTKLQAAVGWVKGAMGYHGDDGRRYSDGNGLPYAEVFSAGDTIGCGVNFNESTVFYTKNGHFLGIAFEGVTGQLYPAISFIGPGAQVYANFGQRPFMFQDFDKVVTSKG